MSRKTKISFTARLIASLLRSRYGPVKAMERGLRLQGVIRFIFLTLLFIVLPSLVLAYFGASSVNDIQRNKQLELTAQGASVARNFIDRMSMDFSSVEDRVLYVLEAGRTPTGTLHKHQRVVLRFNPSSELIAPFTESRQEDKGKRLFFHPSLMLQDSQYDPPPSLLEEKRLSQARALLQAGEPIAAQNVLAQLANPEGDAFSIGGGRLNLIASFMYAKTLPDSDKSGQLQRILESVLNQPWSIDDGIEGAVAIEALSTLRQLNETSRDQARFDDLRTRLELRMEQLYWTRVWEKEWRSLLTDSRQTTDGSLIWTVSKNAIWAKTNWNGDTYLFGIDKKNTFASMKKDLSFDEEDGRLELSAELLNPGEADPQNMIVRRYMPWLEGWSVAVRLVSPEEYEALQSSEKNRRLAFVGFAVFSMIFGFALTIKVAAKEIEVANIKSSFAASVSHELRSPITQIRLKGESLMFGLAETEQELEEHYESIVRESERLSWLVDNVLDYASIERDSKQYMLRYLDINETVQRVIDSLQVTLTMRDVEISISLSEPFLIRHDPDAVSQCVINLLSNAAKYSDDDKRIDVVIRRLSNSVDVVVADHGIGINPEEINRIFEPFYRSREASARRRKGTGIGLSITKHIMEAHGGMVLVQSRREIGSSFTLRFPSILIASEGEQNV